MITKQYRYQPAILAHSNDWRNFVSGSGYIMMLLTDAGGHVGWPLGLNPRKEGWKWMNNAVSSFTNSVHLAKLEQK